MNENHVSLPQEFPEWAEQSNTLIHYKKNEQVYLEKEPAHHFYYLKSGRVRIYVTSAGGNEKTLAVYHAHAIFGEAAFFDGSPRMSSARAVQDSQIIPIGRHEILNYLQEHPIQALSMIESLAKTVRNLSTQINEISFLPANCRIARFLLNESQYGQKEVHCTHDEIASRVGCSRITVSRILADLRKQALLETRYGSIVVDFSTQTQQSLWENAASL